MTTEGGVQKDVQAPMEENKIIKSSRTKWIKLVGTVSIVTVICVAYSSLRAPVEIISLTATVPNFRREGVLTDWKIKTQSVKHSNSSKRLCFRFMGRLGNRMFQFAALVGIARMKGMVPVIQSKDPLSKIFVLDGFTKIKFNLCKQVKVHQNKRSCAYDAQSVNFANTKDTGLFGYYQSWRYFRESFHEVRRLLTIKSAIRETCVQNLKTSVKDQQGQLVLKNLVYVGVHIRRGDMATSSRAIKNGHVIASIDYLNKAMRFFRGKFKHVLFVVCSDDKLWPFLHLPHNDTVFMSGQTSEQDMTTLSLCNHSIITVGSFGWWSAWLANGITLYPRKQYRPGSNLGTQFNISDHMLPSWIPID